MEATRQRLERALDVVARAFSEPGGEEQFTPLFERLERERDELKARASTAERAKQRLKRAA